MASEESAETTTMEPKLSLFSVSPKMKLCPSEPSGMLTPPLRASSAAVPFRWEEEPGKPRPCTALLIRTAAAQLELPPRLLAAQEQPSPSTILLKRPKASSFRMTISTRRKESGFGAYGSFYLSPEREIVVSKRLQWLFGGWRRSKQGKGKATSEVAAGDTFVFPCDSLSTHSHFDDHDDDQLDNDDDDGWGPTTLTSFNTTTNITPSRRSFALLSSSQTKSHFWASIYGGLKQVIPWKGKKLNKTASGFVNS